jgi:DNA-binding MarR family transcriptional regulator
MNKKLSFRSTADMSAWYGIRSFAERAIAESPLNRLDPLSIRLIDWIYTARSSPDPLYVQTIITKSNVASPATLHKCLSALLREGLIQSEIDPVDTRRKVISITPRLSQAMQELDQKTKRWLEGKSKDA